MVVRLTIILSFASSLASCSGPKSPADQVLAYMAEDPDDADREEIGLKKLTLMGAEAIDPIVKFYKKHSWWPWDPKREIAALALECIARVRERHSLPRVMELSKERDRLLSLCAVYAIRAMATEEDVGDVVRLIDDRRFVWKARLIELLGRLGGDEARKALLRYLEDRRGRVRRGALVGFKALGDPSFIPEVRQAFQAEKNPELRIAAAETLASLGDEVGGAHLAAVLEGDSPDYLLVTAGYASGRVREKKAVPGLIKLLGHQEWCRRDVARGALTLIGTDEALKAIEERLPEDEKRVSVSTEARYFYTFDREEPFMDWDWVYED